MKFIANYFYDWIANIVDQLLPSLKNNTHRMNTFLNF